MAKTSGGLGAGLGSLILKKTTLASPDVRLVAPVVTPMGVVSLSLDASVARRAESTQVVERVGVAALGE